MPAQRRSCTATILAIAVAVSLSSCGGGSSSDVENGSASTESTVAYEPISVSVRPHLTRAKFAVHANSICKRKWPFVLHAFREYQDDLRTLEPQLTNKQRFVKAVRLSYFAAITFHIYDWIRNLGAAPGEQKAVEDLLASMYAGLEQGQEGPTPITNKPEARALFDEYNRLARRHGMDECLVRANHLPHGDARNSP